MEEKPLEERLCKLLQTVIENNDNESVQEQALTEIRSLIPTLPQIWLRQNDDIQQEAFNEAILIVDSRFVNRFVYPKKENKKPISFDDDDALEISQKFVLYFNGTVGNYKKRIRARNAKQWGELTLDNKLPTPQGSDGDRNETFKDIPTYQNLPWNHNCDPNAEGIVPRIIYKEQQYLRVLLSYVKADPKGILTQERSHKYPQANCLEILESRILKNPPEEWEDLATRLHINYNTLISFWSRRKKFISDYIKNTREAIDDHCGENFLNYIQTDSENSLKECFLKNENQPELNAQKLALRYFSYNHQSLPPREDIFLELSDQYQVRRSEIENFFEKECLPLWGKVIDTCL